MAHHIYVNLYCINAGILSCSNLSLLGIRIRRVVFSLLPSAFTYEEFSLGSCKASKVNQIYNLLEK